jgi:putative PEP-CTERM system histidine kinase
MSAGMVPYIFLLDLARPVAWLGLVIHLYRRAVLGGGQPRQIYFTLALIGGLAVAAILLFGHGAAGMNLGIVWVMALLALAVGTLLVVENLYLATPEDVRWHVALPCIALAALAGYDAVLAGDTLLSRALSPLLFNVRPVAMMTVVPLFAAAAARNRRNWQAHLRLSRTAALHTATLIVAGLFLLGLVAASQAVAYVGADWAGVVKTALLFGGVVGLALLVTSRSARSRLRFWVIDNFFAHRFDYRREWMRCIATLSATQGYVALHARVIRAVADIVDSPGGVLFVRETNGSFEWAGSWCLPAATASVPPDSALVAGLRGGDWIVDLAAIPPQEGLPAAWLAVPLTQGGELTGFVLLDHPRAPFTLDREVFDLLRVVGRQVATVVAEQRATEVLMQTRQLHEYSKRFAFVAHDIKNVSTQLSLLLSNAETHLANPDFQRDMLATIRAAVAKIGALVRRLETPETPLTRSVIQPAERLAPIIESARRTAGLAIAYEAAGPAGSVAMPPASFDAVVTHLLTNAVEATTARHPQAPPPVHVTLRQEGRRTVIDITDEGPGMDPDFVRDGLFRPFRTSKPGGSGIGAYQARELLREAGGDLVVITQPGAGTTMRLLLPTVEAAAAAAA